MNKNLAKGLLGLSAAWLVYAAASYCLGLKPYSALEPEANIAELAVGFSAAVLLFVHYYKSKQFLSLGIGLAVISWTLGELFWFSNQVITVNPLPYPSVGEFGFLGVYFFLAGAIGGIKNNGRHPLVILLLTLLIVLIPVFLVFHGKGSLGALIYNFVFIAAIAFISYKALSKYTSDYRYLFWGILFFCLTDIIFIIEANTRDYTFICDMLYPLALSLLAYGAMKEGAHNS
ncbi:MAG: hypothetical protein ACM3PE_05465 [Deltaproteobacteria bacterium]